MLFLLGGIDDPNDFNWSFQTFFLLFGEKIKAILLDWYAT